MELHLTATVSLVTWDHTLLPATRHKWTYPGLRRGMFTCVSQTGWYSIYLPRRDGKLSWPRWPVTYRDGLPARRRSPIQVLTWPSVD